MKQEFKAKWLADLRSGQYKQGRKQLRDEYDQYCCLGVLCDGLGVRWEKLVSNYGASFSDPDGMSTAYLPEDVRELVGITVMDQARLVNLNDSDLWNFEQIAEYVEEML